MSRMDKSDKNRSILFIASSRTLLKETDENLSKIIHIFTLFIDAIQNTNACR